MNVYGEFDLPVTAYPPGGRLSDTDVTAELQRMAPGGSHTHYVWLIGDGREDILEALRIDPEWSVNAVDSFPARTLVRLHDATEPDPVHDLLEETGGRLLKASGTGSGWQVTVRFPDGDALSGFFEGCRDRGIPARLSGVNEAGFRGSADYGLTPAQHEAVVTAAKAGYFEVPREATIDELADRLEVSDQAVSERLRRGLGKHLAAMLGGADAEAGTDVDGEGPIGPDHPAENEPEDPLGTSGGDPMEAGDDDPAATGSDDGNRGSVD